MTAGPVYCIDTSAILEGRVRAYPPDHFVQLWQNIEQLIASGRLVAPEEVRIELERKDDDVFGWAKGISNLFISYDTHQMREVMLIANRFPLFVNNPKVKNRADPFVIALAKERGCIVVTEERPGSPDSPKIPFVCDHFRVPHIRFLDIVRREGWRF